MSAPRDIIQATEHGAPPPGANSERFAGWGVMGLPFASGHILGLRRFPHSSLGSGYTSVWHRSPDGQWRFYADVEPSASCSRYFGRALAEATVSRIELEWTKPNGFSLSIPAERLEWQLECETTPATRVMNGMARIMPEAAWKNKQFLKLMGPMAGAVLRAGRLRLQGDTPNGQWFITNPRRVWAVSSATASLNGEFFGEPGPVRPQAQLGDFWIPQRGLLAIGNASFEAFDKERHSAQTVAVAPDHHVGQP